MKYLIIPAGYKCILPIYQLFSIDRKLRNIHVSNGNWSFHTRVDFVFLPSKDFEWVVSKWLSFKVNSVIFQLYHGELIFNEKIRRSAYYKTNTLSWIFIVLAHWNNSLWVDMAHHSDTLSWFRANESCFFFWMLRA